MEYYAVSFSSNIKRKFFRTFFDWLFVREQYANSLSVDYKRKYKKYKISKKSILHWKASTICLWGDCKRNSKFHFRQQEL